MFAGVVHRHNFPAVVAKYRPVMKVYVSSKFHETVPLHLERPTWQNKSRVINNRQFSESHGAEIKRLL